MQTYYLALVDKTATTFNATYARHDENMLAFHVSQQEGDFCGLTVEIKKPSKALLDPDRPQWVWLSMEEGTTLTPLFFGRVVGIPTDIQEDVVQVEFIARPVDFQDQKKALAATLRVHPYWDWAFTDPQMWEDPDAVIEARTDVWHIDRVSHDVTISSIIEGEDGTLSLTSDLIAEDEFDLSYKDTPLRKVTLEMRAMWTQQVKGQREITKNLLDAFKEAGSKEGFVTSYTGQGLYDNWPMPGDSLSGVYSFGEQTLELADGKGLKKKWKAVNIRDDGNGRTGRVHFRRWGFIIKSFVKHNVEIDRTEDISFEVFADVQDMMNDAEDEMAETIALSSGNIGKPVGPGSGVELPIGNVARDAFFPSARGALAIKYGLCHARSLLVRRARAVEIKVTVPFTTAIQATCRKSATVYHPGLPGGVATGKIVSYDFGVDGESGVESGIIAIACMVGKNSTFAEVTGTPTYVSADYVGSDYQEFRGGKDVDTSLGMRFTRPTSEDVKRVVVGLKSVEVTNGEKDQKKVLKKTYADANAVCDALNDACTLVDLRMKPIDVSPRDLRYETTDVDLKLPTGINLGGL